MLFGIDIVVMVISVILVVVLIVFGVKLWRNRIVTIKIYYDKEKKKIKRIYYTQHNVICGEDTFYYPTGEKNKVQHWSGGKKNGLFIVYYKNGSKYIEGNFYNDSYVGDYFIYNINGELLTQYKY